MIIEHLEEKTLRHEEEPVLTLRLRRPEVQGERRSARRMEQYYAQLAEIWRARWEISLWARACESLEEARNASRPWEPWEARLDYWVSLEEENLASLYVDASERLGGSRVMTVRTADTWDLKTGTPCVLSEFLPRRPRWKKELLQELSQQASARMQSGESLLFQDADERVCSLFSPHRFYLEENRVVLFYPMLSLGSYAEGIPLFSLPRNRTPDAVPESAMPAADAS